MYYRDHRLRHELKYYINYNEYYSMRQKLKVLLKKDSFSIGNEGYHIRSLYFDDVYDSSLYEKNAGVFKREKYRIRIYNKKDSQIKLECKSKFGQYISKESVSISRDHYELLMQNRPEFLIERKHPLLKMVYGKIKSRLLKPKVIVDYYREAYIYDPGNVRITFDKNLQAGLNSFDVFDNNLVVADTFKEGEMVLEIKYDDFLPGFIQSIIQGTYQNISAVSKYVICREVLNHYTMK